jgi:cyanophycinase-like exopeptidase
MTGRLVVMGSGETAPTMIKVHRRLFELVGDSPALLLDTPYGFQENADEITARARKYFCDSVGRSVDVLSWREEPVEGLARERALAALRAARWVFAGPGSPTYALRQWTGTPLPVMLADVVRSGGVVVFASAAALTLGSHAVPVYEIYKAGEPACWRPGLDLVHRLTGLYAVVIPHYDNAEGGHHDTRYCYLGERRLALLERELPDEAFVLGVDEHTGCILDPSAETVTVVGNGTVTSRRRGLSSVFVSGSVVTFGELTGGRVVTPAAVADDRAGAAVNVATSLRAAADAHETAFVSALCGHDIAGCVAAILALEQSLADWSADTLTSDEADHAHSLLRSMVVRLGGLAEHGGWDPRAPVAPFVDALLRIRSNAREAKDFATSDAVRDSLAAAGVEVRDTPTGVEWEFATSGKSTPPRTGKG